jgi:outer membrane biosynthesis protein TonB
MVSFAHLSREERIGLGIAAAAHVALVAALVLQVRDNPTPLPIPERMDVSLASEVSLESTAPDPTAEAQAAVAPVLAPEPAPEPVPTSAPEPAPVQARERPRPTPTPQPTRAAARPTPMPSARPTAQPSRAPEPRPAATQPAGGSRIGANFLEGAGVAEGDRGTPARRAGPSEMASIQAAMARQIKPKWSAPQGVDAEKLVTYLSWDLNSDGSLKGRPRVERQEGITASNRPQAQLHAERAIRAVQLAAPFDLPEEYYDVWKSPRNVKFDRNL